MSALSPPPGRAPRSGRAPPWLAWLDRWLDRSVGGGPSETRSRARVLASGSVMGAVVLLIAVVVRFDEPWMHVATVGYGFVGFVGTLVALAAGVPTPRLLPLTLAWHTLGLTAEALSYGPGAGGVLAPFALVPLAWVWGGGVRHGLLATLWTMGVLCLLAAGVGGRVASPADASGLVGIASAAVVGLVISAVYDLERHQQLRALEAERRRSELAVQAGRLGLVQWVDSQDLATLSPRARRILGYDPDEVVPWRALMSRVGERHRPAAAQLPCVARANGGRAGMELEWTRPDGELRWLVCDVLADPTGIDPEVVFTVRDATPQRREAALREEFLGNVSHELRSPLTALSGALTLLAAEGQGRHTPEDRRFIELAQSNGARVLRLVDDLLELQRGESGALTVEFSSTSVAAVIRDLAASAPPTWPALRLTLAELPSIQTDPSRLAQVVTNLLSNAARVSPPGAPIDVRVVAAAGGGVRIEVADQGPGIPEAFRGRIFQRFAQVRSKPGSSGLGLAISKALVTRLSGTIGFQSVEGQGATFWIELPRVPPQVHALNSLG